MTTSQQDDSERHTEPRPLNTTTHQDRRTRRQRTRHDAKQHAIAESMHRYG
jgi:hypothetical protein